jgi:hypothetical protein
MSGFLCQQSLVYIVQFIIFNIISVFVFGMDLQMKIIKLNWIHVLIMFIISIIGLQVLCHFQFNKTAWGLLILHMIFSSLLFITAIIDPKIKQKVEENIKKKEEENQK